MEDNGFIGREGGTVSDWPGVGICGAKRTKKTATFLKFESCQENGCHSHGDDPQCIDNSLLTGLGFGSVSKKTTTLFLLADREVVGLSGEAGTIVGLYWTADRNQSLTDEGMG